MDAQNHSVEANTDSVHLSLLTELKSGDCYFLNASNGTFTILQWGLYSKSNNILVQIVAQGDCGSCSS